MTAEASENIAERLRRSAARDPDRIAIAYPTGRGSDGLISYRTVTFRELDELCDRLAAGLLQLNVGPETRLVLMVRPGLEFIALTFAILRSGAVCVLIDPGMGRTNIFNCLQEVEPDGFVAIPVVQAIRCLNRFRFPDARTNVTVGRRWFWGGASYRKLARTHVNGQRFPTVTGRSSAAIIFTSGSTGPPKGVLYEHGIFAAQVDLLQRHFDIQPGEVDLPGFPLFGLFNAAMGVTTVIPHMDPTRPANVDPEAILQPAQRFQVTQAFGSPALWNRVGRYCRDRHVSIPSIRRVLSAGAPVSNEVLQLMLDALSEEDAKMFTPYGATEALPVASISARQVLHHTATHTRNGAGTCVGRPFPDMEIRIISANDEPISDISQAPELPTGEIGEIIVQGPVVTREYFRRPDATRLAKIQDGAGFWHRMGDVGYLDEQGQLWFCGRKAHVVHAESGPMYPVRCEAIFNTHPHVYRSALVGRGPRGEQQPVIIIEPEPDHFPESSADIHRFRSELLTIASEHALTKSIREILFHRDLPVDIRHNVKINREQLAVWAESQQSPLAAADRVSV